MTTNTAYQCHNQLSANILEIFISLSKFSLFPSLSLCHCCTQITNEMVYFEWYFELTKNVGFASNRTNLQNILETCIFIRPWALLFQIRSMLHVYNTQHTHTLCNICVWKVFPFQMLIQSFHFNLQCIKSLHFYVVSFHFIFIIPISS